MEDNLFRRFRVGVALFLMVLELTYINAKSLSFLVQDYEFYDDIFAIIGSLAFSIVTVTVMQEVTEKWVKITFPVFDALLVFCGFNLKYYDAIMNGTDNKVRFWLSVFMALFSGLITYCLGIINFYKKSKSDLKVKDEKIKLLESETNTLHTQVTELSNELSKSNSQLYSLQTDIEKYKRDINSLNSELKNSESWLKDSVTKNENYKSEIEKLTTQIADFMTNEDIMNSIINKLGSDIVQYKTDIDLYKPHYLKSERSRILKKNEENRTESENQLLQITNEN
jgi:uncharacterized membrane protein SirB2